MNVQEPLPNCPKKQQQEVDSWVYLHNSFSSGWDPFFYFNGPIFGNQIIDQILKNFDSESLIQLFDQVWYRLPS